MTHPNLQILFEKLKEHAVEQDDKILHAILEEHKGLFMATDDEGNPGGNNPEAPDVP